MSQPSFSKIEKTRYRNKAKPAAPDLYALIKEHAGEGVAEYLVQHLPKGDAKVLYLATTTRFNILNQPPDDYAALVNLKKVNDVRFLNKFFEAVNSILPLGALYINSVTTYKIRKARLLAKYPPVINWMVYTIDFALRRVFPKLPVTKQIYFYLTQGNGRVLSKAETFGRLYSCGFEVIDEKLIGNELFFVARKRKEPVFDLNPTYGPLIRLRRVGKGGKMIGVYKARTMHPYAEYLQEYVYQRSNLAEGGKFNDDFRITTLGRFMRKFWLDELPMLINLFKGDLKLVGVRPLSRHYFSLYPEEVQKRRIAYKPGLIPPYYADMPKTFDEIVASEVRYMDACDKSCFITDFRYFWKAMYNIFLRNARSK